MYQVYIQFNAKQLHVDILVLHSLHRPQFSDKSVPLVCQAKLTIYVIVITRSRDDYMKYNLECALAHESYISRKHRMWMLCIFKAR